MKFPEVIRAFTVTILGAILLFVIQPALYLNFSIPLNDVQKVEEWVNFKYLPAAVFLLGVCLVAQVIWYALALRFKGDEKDASKMGLLWWFVCVGVILGIAIAIFLSAFTTGGSSQAVPSLFFFFLLDGAILYWLATAISTPNRALKYIVPGSFYLRRYRLFS
jgi:predicted membrane protein